MKRTCLVCNNVFEPEDNASPAVVLGVCADCCDALDTKPLPVPLADYLDQFAAPILVMTDDVRVAGYNEAARKMLGSKADAAIGRLGGEVIECEYAEESGGCGKAEHCKACAIRHAVNATHTTGQNKTNISATQRISTGGGSCEVRFLISTEKAGRFVLLRIDAVKLNS